ncbi:MAG TPA: hypothetical protein VK559_02300 [Ferruginibacter sp.]|nr:hypothetical protein [Ferruginibacter sp.]
MSLKKEKGVETPRNYPGMLKIETKYYIYNRKQLLKKYSNKFIVIKGKKVIGSYDSHKEAVSNTINIEELGTFIIEHCEELNKIG